MKKYFLFSIAAIFFSFGSFSQSRELPTLESLKKQVPNLKDTALVNCLNLIAYNFNIVGFGPGPSDFIRRSDSIFHYANLAYKVSKKINYKKGMVDALNLQAGSENVKKFGLRLANQNDSASKTRQTKYVQAAIALAEKINYNDGLGGAYYRWTGETRNDTIDYMKKSLPYFKKAGNKRMEGEVCTWIAEGYLYKGYYENAFEYCQRGLLLNHEMVNTANTKEELGWREYLYQQSLSDMAALYKAAGDYESSLEYFEIATQFGIKRNTGWTMEDEKAEIFRLTGRNDSSFYYLRKAGDTSNTWTKRDIAATYLRTKQYDSALIILKQIEPGFRKNNVRGNLLPVLFYIGSAYAGKNENNNALPYAREATSDAEYLGRRPDMMNSYELLSRIHRNLGNNDSAYEYLLKYSLLKDSIQSRQFLFQINNYKKATDDEKKKAQLGFLIRDNKIKQQQLKQQTVFRNFLFALLFTLVLIGIFVFRNTRLKRKYDRLQRKELEQQLNVQQLESAKQHAELQQKASELEMQALRAQMNPHFIFNCLSSINRFILKNEVEAASDYLTRFSRLIRMVLINSQQSLISLEDELEMLRLYLDMERLRFKNAFDYNITFTNRIDAGSVYIPPLLLQPFCENAIWHGLMHKDGHGELSVSLSMDEGSLKCLVADNGIGRKKAAELKSKSAEKEKSLGLQITKDRLALINDGINGNAFFHIDDLIDENGQASGTRTFIKIKVKDYVGVETFKKTV